MTTPLNADVCTPSGKEAMAVVLSSLLGAMNGAMPIAGDQVLEAVEAIIERGEFAEFGRRVLQLVIERRMDVLKSRRAEVVRSLGKITIKRVH